MLDQSQFLTVDGVDATTLVGKRVWFRPYGDGSLKSFVLSGLDISLGMDGGAEVRAYDEDREQWILVKEVRSKPGEWAEVVYRKMLDKVASDASDNGLNVSYVIAVHS